MTRLMVIFAVVLSACTAEVPTNDQVPDLLLLDTGIGLGPCDCDGNSLPCKPCIYDGRVAKCGASPKPQHGDMILCDGTFFQFDGSGIDGVWREWKAAPLVPEMNPGDILVWDGERLVPQPLQNETGSGEVEFLDGVCEGQELLVSSGTNIAFGSAMTFLATSPSVEYRYIRDIKPKTAPVFNARYILTRAAHDKTVTCDSPEPCETGKETWRYTHHVFADKKGLDEALCAAAAEKGYVKGLELRWSVLDTKLGKRYAVSTSIEKRKIKKKVVEEEREVRQPRWKLR